jgi:rRNA-processing protein FCF1
VSGAAQGSQITVHTFAVLDTNIWLHFRAPRDTDWKEFLGSESVTLVVPPVVVGELDDQKDRATSSRLRERARSALKTIESWHGENLEIRPGVRGVVLDLLSEPDARELGLDPTRGDDRLLASARDLSARNGAARVVVVTNDTGMRIKARQLSIEVLAPADDSKLADELDPVEKENRDLRRRLDRLESRLPELGLKIEGGVDSGTRIHAELRFEPPISLQDAIRAASSAAELEAPVRRGPNQSPILRRPSAGGFDLSQLRNLPPLDPAAISLHEFERYEQERQTFLTKSAEFAERKWKRDEYASRSVHLVLVLTNSGTAPAEDISVALEVPAGPLVSRAIEFPESDPPVRPIEPRTNAQKSANRASAYELLESLSRSLPDVPIFTRPQAGSTPIVSGPHVKEQGPGSTRTHRIEYEVSRLKQHDQLELGAIELLYNRREDARSMAITYRINCATLPGPIEGELSLVLRV